MRETKASFEQSSTGGPPPSQADSPSSTRCSPLASPSTPATLTFSVWQMFVVAMVMLTSLGGYLLVLKLRGPDARIITKTDLDDVIPFQPGWVWVYLIPYLIGPVVIGFMRLATFHWYISRGIAVMLITLIIFIVFPTQTAERPG